MKFKIYITTALVSFIGTFSAQNWDFTEAVKLNENINSEAEESMPVFSKDSMILYYVRTYEKANHAGEYDQDIWFTKKVNGEFSKTEKLDQLNNEYNNAVFGVNSSGNSLYLLSSYEGKKDMIKGCATSNLSSSKWSKPLRIDIPNLVIEGDFYTFNMNKKDDVLIISYIGENSLGEEDIYYSLKDKASGNWSTPKTVGNTINTKGFEISPFLSVTGDTLFFSSNGHGGFGDADIFYSVKQGSWDNWAAPVNLGYKVNSAKFDAYFSYSANDVFWSSNRDSKYADIYTSKPFIITPIIAEAKGTDVTVFKGNDGKIDLKVSGGKAPYDFTWSNGVKVQNPATLIKGEYMVLIKDVWNQEVELTVVINEPLPVKQDLEEIIYFDLDKYALNEENVSTLNSFLVQLKGKENYTLEIVSHCDQRASESYNIRLSKNRLNTVNKYLLKNGVSKQIIQGQYKGKSSLLIDCDNCTDDEYRKNRRTTIKVVMK